MVTLLNDSSTLAYDIDPSALAYDVRALEVSLGGTHILGPLDLPVARGSFLGILGPNGSGKTTLLRTLTGALVPSSGQVLLEQQPLSDYEVAELARLVGVVPQQFTLDFAFTVEEMVRMGRYAHGASPVDEQAVAAALQATGMSPLAERLVTELSGGERQRALIAQTLAQQTPILLLDEPLNNLDLNHQLEIMQLLRSLHEEGRTVVIVLHDLNMAAQYCDELALLDQGRLAVRGAPAGVLDPISILEVFKVRVAVHREGPRPYITPIWSKPTDGLQVTGQKVHVVAGGGSASELLEELVGRGLAPTVGIVSVFDTDYTVAQKYGLEVISAPPFEPFPQKVVEEYNSMAQKADVIIVAPVFFGKGNLAVLRTALHAAQASTKVVIVGSPPIAERDLAGGEATALVEELLAAGALEVTDATHAIEAALRPSEPEPRPS